ncbi:carph-isopro domain-containing protein [Sphingomonas sp. PB2P19]|uniref:carph-isopro domain-containing protein n=1 Tax=Sphingomonas rhamnosi TaxID=3096156 RepID=UPI003FA6D76B
MEARSIIRLFGGIRPMARALRHRSPTTVQGWRNRNLIPAKHQAHVLARAKTAGLPLIAADIIPDVDFGDEHVPGSGT